jgi:hypothetical protein
VAPRRRLRYATDGSGQCGNARRVGDARHGGRPDDGAADYPAADAASWGDDASARAGDAQGEAGRFGLLGATVRVADDTQIRIMGQPASLADIKEGAKVKASYEVRDGNNLAKSIEVMPAASK